MSLLTIIPKHFPPHNEFWISLLKEVWSSLFEHKVGKKDRIVQLSPHMQIVAIRCDSFVSSMSCVYICYFLMIFFFIYLKCINSFDTLDKMLKFVAIYLQIFK